MGAGFQNTNGQNIDFVVDPNLELYKQLADARVKSNYLSTVLVEDANDIQIDYDEADADLVNEKKALYADQIRNMVQGMAESPENFKNKMGDLRNLSHTISTDYAKGDLKKVMKTAEEIKRQEEYEKTLNPIDRERSRRYVQSWRDNNPEGSINKPFQSADIQPVVAIWQEFLKAGLPGIKPSGGSVSRDSRGGFYITTKENQRIGVSKEAILKAARTYALSHPEFMAYAQQEADLFGDTSWLDENGQVTAAEGSRLGKLLDEGAEAYQYSQVNSSTSLKTDSAAIQNAIFAREDAERRRQAEAARQTDMATGGHQNLDFLKQTPLGEKAEEDYIKAKEDYLVSILSGAEKDKYDQAQDKSAYLADLESRIRTHAATDNSSKIAAGALDRIQAQYQSMFGAGFSSITQHTQLSEKGYKEVLPTFRDRMQTNIYGFDGYFGNANGTSLILGSSKKFKLKDVVDKEINGGDVIKQVFPDKTSHLPSGKNNAASQVHMVVLKGDKKDEFNKKHAEYKKGKKAYRDPVTGTTVPFREEDAVVPSVNDLLDGSYTGDDFYLETTTFISEPEKGVLEIFNLN